MKNKLTMRILTLLFLGLLLLPASSISQQPVHITLISDTEKAEVDDDYDFLQSTKSEILTLLQERYTITFSESYAGHSPQAISTALDNAFADEQTDIVVAVGTMSSGLLALRPNFEKPAIASIIIDPQLQQIGITPEGTSGKPNFTYLATPFDIKRDLEMLHRIHPYQHLGVVGGTELINSLPFLGSLFENYLQDIGAKVDVVTFRKNVEQTLSDISPEVDAVYVLPLFDDMSEEELGLFFEKINERKLPSAALLGERYLENGALIGYQSATNLQRMPRRIALNVMKILEGADAGNLPVGMESYTENLSINMATSRLIEVYPDWDVMSEATQLKIDVLKTDRVLTLEGAIAEAMQSNLALRVAQAEPQLSQKDIDLAISDMLPQVDVSTSYQAIDKNTALTRQGAQGQLNWLASGSFSQLVLAEPVFANIAIQRILKKSAEYGLVESQLDVVIDVSEAYLNVLRAKSNLDIQQQNLAVTRENYDITRAKEAVGYSGASDINRWEAQLALANIELNDAVASYRQARFLLNQLLNRPINEEFQLEDVTLGEQMLMVTDTRLNFINNYGELDRFSDFLVEDAMTRLPELGQFDAGIAAQERLELSQQRAFYLPTLAISGSANRVLQKSRVPDFAPDTENFTTWDIGLGLQYPIFQGGARKHSLEQTRIGILQLQDQRADVRNQLELRIRSNMELVGASFSRVELSRQAANASQKNFEIVQDAYSAGQVNIVTLIDAQNNALQTELSALNAVYTFTLDFLYLERSIGSYYFLDSPAERDAFFQRMSSFMGGD